LTSGRVLRTNYRRTGAMNITAIGGAVPKSSYGGVGALLGGPGTNQPYGGFMVFSYCGSFEAKEATAHMAETSGPAGCSNAWVESTHAAMSAFYGEGMFGDGYVFMPVGMDLLAYSNVSLKGGQNSFPGFRMVNVHTSDSYFVVSAVIMGTSAAQASAYFCSEADFQARVWGFIISAP
jgi:hypothetical protein